jgi:membrane-bound ClpP family serine protease
MVARRGDSGVQTACAPTARGTVQPTLLPTCLEDTVIILGVVLLVLGLLLKVAILTTIGIILAVIGLVLLLVGSTGRAIGGRKHYF